MRRLVLGAGLVAVADVLGQVLGEVADAPAGVPRTGQNALRVEPHDVQGFVVVADRAERLVPGRQDLTRPVPHMNRFPGLMSRCTTPGVRPCA